MVVSLHKSARSLALVRTTPYHPQSDGLVEGFNCTLLNMLSAVVQDRHHEWEDHLHATCMEYNTSFQSSTGFTPFYLMFVREARMPLDIMFGPHKTHHQESSAAPSTLSSSVTSCKQPTWLYGITSNGSLNGKISSMTRMSMASPLQLVT